MYITLSQTRHHLTGTKEFISIVIDYWWRDTICFTRVLFTLQHAPLTIPYLASTCSATRHIDCCMVCTSATYGPSYSQLHAVLRHKPILCPQGLCGVTYNRCHQDCSFNQQQTLRMYFHPVKGNSIFHLPGGG